MEGSATGGVTNPSGKDQIEEDEEWYVLKEDISIMIVVQLDDAIKSKGVMPKGRKDKKQNQLQICVDNKMAIYQGHVVNMSQLSGFPLTTKWKLLELREEVVEEPMN